MNVLLKHAGFEQQQKKNLIKVEESVITVFLEAEYFMWRWKYFVGEYTSYF